VRVLRAAQRLPLPWKNGGGITFEVASFPKESTLEDFGWRISVAEVREGGPFSVFPNVDRQLAVLEGRLLLHVQGQGATELTQSSPVVKFPGDLPTSAALPAGPVMDLNVMTRRGQFTAELSRQCSIGTEAVLMSRADVTIVMALDRIRVRSATRHHELLQRDALLFTKDEREEVVLEDPPRGEGLRYLLIEILHQQ
jgi:uncharacterized protein